MMPAQDDVERNPVDRPLLKLQPIIGFQKSECYVPGDNYIACISRIIPDKQVSVLFSATRGRQSLVKEIEDQYTDTGTVVHRALIGTYSVQKFALNAVMLGFVFDNAQDDNNYRVGGVEELFKKHKKRFVTMTYSPKA